MNRYSHFNFRTLCHALAFMSAFSMMAVEQFPAEAKSVSRQKVIQNAAVLKGIPYVYGGSSPAGFDCSGLVQYVFAKANIQLPRTADRQFDFGTPVAFAHAKPGDLMFFNTGKARGAVTHVGIYMGKNNMLHAPRPGKKVQFASVDTRSWFRPRLLGIRRVNKQTYQLTRKPVGWEVSMMPTNLNVIVEKLKADRVMVTASL
jgi:hypothetical protein